MAFGVFESNYGNSNHVLFPTITFWTSYAVFQYFQFPDRKLLQTCLHGGINVLRQGVVVNLKSSVHICIQGFVFALCVTVNCYSVFFQTVIASVLRRESNVK
jgi:hypothetical protein